LRVWPKARAIDENKIRKNIPQAHVGHEIVDTNEAARNTQLAIIISHPTTASGITVFNKNAPKIYKTKLKQKEKRPQKITRTLIIFVEHGLYKGS